MNDIQKKLLVAIGAVVLIMLLYPPYRVYGYSGNISFTGYAWLFDLPFRATVDVVTLVVQWLGVSIVGGIAYFILKTK